MLYKGKKVPQEVLAKLKYEIAKSGYKIGELEALYAIMEKGLVKYNESTNTWDTFSRVSKRIITKKQVEAMAKQPKLNITWEKYVGEVAMNYPVKNLTSEMIAHQFLPPQEHTLDEIIIWQIPSTLHESAPQSHETEDDEDLCSSDFGPAEDID